MIFAIASTISDVSNGGMGKSTLYFAGGGTVTMEDSASNFAIAHLAAASTAWNFTANGIAGRRHRMRARRQPTC